MKVLYWYLLRPRRKGAVAIIENDGHLLLQRVGYGHKGWTLPGGGAKKGESFFEAVSREVEEETSLRLRNFRRLHRYTTDQNYKTDEVEVFYAETPFFECEADGFEVLETRWFEIDDVLPSPHENLLEYVLDEFKKKRSANFKT